MAVTKALENPPTMFGQIMHEDLLNGLLENYKLIAEKAVQLTLITECENMNLYFLRIMKS